MLKSYYQVKRKKIVQRIRGYPLMTSPQIQPFQTPSPPWSHIVTLMYPPPPVNYLSDLTLNKY